MRNLAALCAVMALSTHGETWATDLRPEGGEGGDAYRVTCAPGWYLVGVEGSTGDWIDRLRIVCAPISDGALGRPQAVMQDIGSSQGGALNNAQCAGGTAVVEIQANFTRKRGDYVGFLDRLQMHCQDIANGARNPGPAYNPALTSSGHVSMWAVNPGAAPQTCPAGELATGFHGRAGLFVDSLGLVCETAPARGPGAGLGRTPRTTNAQRSLHAAGAGARTVNSPGNARTVAQPDIAAQAGARQYDCGQANSAVSQAQNKLPGVSARSASVAGTSARNAGPSTDPLMPDLNDALNAASTGGARRPAAESAVGISGMQNRAPAGAPCANGTYAPTPPTTSEPAPANNPPASSPASGRSMGRKKPGEEK